MACDDRRCNLAATQAGTVTVEDTGIGMTREAGALFHGWHQMICKSWRR